MKNVKSGHEHPIVCLDAGHYGKYNRSPVLTSYYESEVVWKLTQYEKAELERYGIEVWLTRTQQARDLALVTRGKKSEGADLFESNHSNACDTESVDRPVVIFLLDDNCGVIDEQSQAIAELMGKTIQNTMGTKGAAQIYSRKASHDRDGDGKKNDDYYGVLFGAHQVGTPAIISEHSFHTNKAAAKWLSEDANLRLLAAAKARAIAQWFDVADKVSGDTEKENAAQTNAAASEMASSYAASLNGTYKVNRSVLYLRSGAGTKPNAHGSNKTILTTMPKNAKVRCYGYYTTVYGQKWLYIQYTADGVTYTGFANGKYLKKV